MKTLTGQSTRHRDRSWRGTVLGALLLCCSMAYAQEPVFRLALEEPVQGQSHSGVGNLRGWAVASAGIEEIRIYIDEVFAFTAPYGGLRGDVAAAFPDVATAANSGFSLAYNYSDLNPGVHTIRAEALSRSGATRSNSASFTVVRFDTSFIANPDDLDFSRAQCVINDQQLTIIDALVSGRAVDITLQWRTATQGFELQEIR